MTLVTGLPIDRRDGRLKVTGHAKYAAEFDIENAVHAILVESTITSGTVTGFDLTAAQSAPGVLAILTPENAPQLPQGTSPGQNEARGNVVAIPLLQDNKIRYNGQHIAIVIADTLERAQYAASLVKAVYHEDEAAIRMADMLGEAYTPKHFRNGSRPPDSRRGDPDAAWAAAPIRLDLTYTTPVENHNPMEPHATIALWEGDRLTVYNATQGIDACQHALSAVFGIKPEQIRVICPFVGGGFGCKGVTWPHVALTAMAARQIGRPVKLVLTRAQMYTSNGYRPQTIQHIKIGAAPDGQLTSLQHHVVAEMSTPEIGEFTEPSGLISEMLYACPNVAVTHRLVSLNRPLPTFMRAPGEASGSFALESALDELAAAANIDPIEIRLRNYADSDPHEDKPFSSKALRQCYRAGAEAFGWADRSPQPGSMREGDALIGWGMATATYPVNRSKSSARVILDADGGAVVQAATQVSAPALTQSWPSSPLTLYSCRYIACALSSATAPFREAPISGGSQTAASVGPAVLAAAEAAKQKLFTIALANNRSPLAGAAPADLVLEDGFVRLRNAPQQRVSVAGLLAKNGLERLDLVGSAAPGDEKKQYSMHSFGAQFAEVRIDPLTHEIRVSRYVGAFAPGRILNAKTARSQAIGGIVFGIGMALLEETMVDPNIGRVTNANIAEYLVPVNADIPDIRTIFIEEEDRLINPIGAKGLGELPIVGAAAAVANAVYHATGIRVRNLPIRIEDILV